MTIGIYRLCFNGTDRCYIGQSTNIENRYKQHLSNFANSKANSKMMAAYTIYGKPYLEILCECSVEELNITEDEAIELFDSVKNGFNVLKHADDMPNACGEDHGYAKNSNSQIEQVLELLCDPRIGFAKISEITGVSVNSIHVIACGASHRWLEDKHPLMYAKVMSLKGTRYTIRNSAEARGIKYPSVISPNGTIYKSISNVNAFCRDHLLTQSSFTNVLNGKRKTHKGWRLANNG
jgi:hypothetical protein